MQNRSPIRSTILLLIFWSGAVFAQVDVWPGDVNNNGEVNHYDLLYFGLGFSYQGPPRLQKSVLFQAQNTQVWNNSLPDQTNFAFLDCNGNGHISLDDTIAIRLNYTQRHGIFTPDPVSTITNSGDSLFMVFADDSVLNKTEIEIPIHLGSSIAPVDSFYGIAFSLTYDPERIRAGSFSVQADSNSWITHNGRLQDAPLMMFFENPIEGKLDVAISKSSLVNTSGGGKLVAVSCVIEDNLIGKGFQALEFSFDDVLLITNTQQIKPIKFSSKELNIIPTDIKNVNLGNDRVRIYPNPVNDILNLELPVNSSNCVMNIIGLDGKTHQVKSLRSDRKLMMDISRLSEGYYILHIKTNETEWFEKFIKF